MVLCSHGATVVDWVLVAAAPVTLLQINDVYTTVPIDNQGGLARVATLKKQLSENGHPVIMALAGDFLSPSVASSVSIRLLA